MPRDATIVECPFKNFIIAEVTDSCRIFSEFKEYNSDSFIQIFALLSSFLPGDLDPQGIRRAVITQDGPESRYSRAGLDIVQKTLHPVEELVLCGVTGGCPVPPALKLQGPTGPVYHPMQMKGPSTGFKCNDVTTPA